MGCDIHIVAEKRLRDGTWATCRTYDSIDIAMLSPSSARRLSEESLPWLSMRLRNRNYDLFSALAGVRGNGPEPKGMPGDIAPLTREMAEDWGSDGHSHSWSSVGEMVAAFVEHALDDDEKVNLTELRMNGGTSVREFAGRYFGLDLDRQNGTEDYRFVYWFDN